MKIINVGIDDARWEKLKAIADSERRHIKHQAALVLENWIDERGTEAALSLERDGVPAVAQNGQR